jgi:hypothetical protein
MPCARTAPLPIVLLAAGTRLLFAQTGTTPAAAGSDQRVGGRARR